MMATTSFILAFPMAWIWPFIQNGLNAFSTGLLDSNTGLAVFLFGFIKRLLIPFGLHHIFHAPFWFEFGSWKMQLEKLFEEINVFLLSKYVKVFI